MGIENKKQGSRTGLASCYEAGGIYPAAIGLQDCVLFDIDDSGITLNIFLHNATGHEIEQMKSGMKFEMKLLQMRGVIFGLFKFGCLHWMDAPYNVHLSRNLTKLEMPKDGCGFTMVICLFDTATGRLCHSRLISLSTEMSRKLIEMAAEQKKMPFNRADYDNRIRSIFACYPTSKLVKMASCSYRIT